VQIGSGIATSGTSFSDSGLSASTTYLYRVRARDAAGNLSGYSNTASSTTLSGGGSSITVSVSPRRGGLTVSQKLTTLTATLTNDTTNQGVTWSSVGGGSFAPTTSTSGNPVTFTAPAAAGVVTITATSMADGSKTASATVGVTDLKGVTTYMNGNSRQGANIQEYALTRSGPTAVNSTNFGKLFSCPVDAAIYAQPLWVANLSIAGAVHNVIYVATQHDTVYAFDADGSSCVPLWTASLIDTAHGGSTGETWVTSADESGCRDLTPDIGIVGTPVIDLSSNSLYVVSKTKNSGTFHQRLHKLNITSGNELLTPPTEISATVSGTGVGSSGGQVSFDAKLNNQRSALLLEGSHVIISWASHCDFGPYHGWVMSYSASALTREAVLNVSPNGAMNGVWMSGSGPAADSSGNIYLATGNGTFDANTGGSNYGDSIVKLGPPSGGNFSSISYFRSFEQQPSPDFADVDQGSGGVLLLPDLPAGSFLAQAGKDGRIYLADRSGVLGGFNSSTNAIAQEVSGQIPGGMWGSPAYWNDTLYFGAAEDGSLSSDPLRAFSFNSGQISGSPTSTTSSTKIFGFSGPTPSVSASGTSNGIVWALDNAQWSSSCTAASTCQGLYAYDATSLGTMLYNSNQAASGRDLDGGAVKFTVPTVANGKVYLGNQNKLTVYGLLP